MEYHKVSSLVFLAFPISFLSFSACAEDMGGVSLPAYLNLSVSKVETRTSAISRDASAPSEIYKPNFYKEDDFKEFFDVMTYVKNKAEHPVEFDQVPVSDTVEIDIKPTLFKNIEGPDGRVNDMGRMRCIGIQFEAKLF